MKKLLIVFLFMSFFIFTSIEAYAQEGYVDELSYDLNLSHSSVSFTYTNDLGEEITLKVEPGS